MSEQRDLIDRLEHYRHLVGTQLKALPEGTLHIVHAKERVRFYRYPGKGKQPEYLSLRNADAIRPLAQKDYLCQMERALNNALDNVRGTVAQDVSLGQLSAVYDSLDPLLKEFVTPLILSDGEFAKRWSSMPFKRKEFWDDDGYFLTKRGEKVRSKSEKIIADLLFDRDIPYRYECSLQLPDHCVYPDFTVLNPRTRRELYWEHFGMLDKEAYAEMALRKLNAYVSAGFVPGIDLIITHESAGCPLNMKLLEKIAEFYFY